MFAATLAFNGSQGDWPNRVCLKFAVGQEDVQKLKHEAQFYQHELRQLAGDAVPKCYGFFTGMARDKELGCLVLDLCNGEDVPLIDKEEFK